jgi:hypothetical protein
VLSPGYTFQGKLIRPVIVHVQKDGAAAEPAGEQPPAAAESGQSQLSLGSVESSAA